MSRGLIEAAVEVFGPYCYSGVRRQPDARTQAHIVLEDLLLRDRVDRVAKEALGKMNEADEDPKNRTRWGYEPVESAGNKVIEDSQINAFKIASAARSELDPAWVLSADPEEVIALAGTINACRELSRMYMKMSVQAANAD